MSGSLVALCADTTSLQHPESIGLAGENLAAQDWLRIFSSAEEARRFLRTDRLVDEVWVASSDDVAPINLAATLKRVGERQARLIDENFIQPLDLNDNWPLGTTPRCCGTHWPRGQS